MQKRLPAKNKSLSLTPLLSLARRVEDFLIPPLCVVCNGALHVESKGGRPTAAPTAGEAPAATSPISGDGGRWLCPSCIDALNANHGARRDACPRCSINPRKRECACEFAWDFPFERVFSVYDYDDTVSAVAQHIKYQGKSRLAHRIGVIAAPLIPDDFWAGADTIIPVPLHKARMRRRGYNQAEWFARGVIGNRSFGDDAGSGANIRTDTGTGINTGRAPVLRTDLLVRVKNTGTQTALDKESRAENLAGAFAANPKNAGELAGRSVILVDDIFTTGATTEACAAELLRAGCAAVRVLSLGRD